MMKLAPLSVGIVVSKLLILFGVVVDTCCGFFHNTPWCWWCKSYQRYLASLVCSMVLGIARMLVVVNCQNS